MLRVFHHYFSARKLTFFLAESSAIAVACMVGAVAFAMALSPGGSPLTGPRLWMSFVLLSAAFVGVFQFSLYLLDLYDLRIASEDRQKGLRFLKAAGLTTMGVGGLMLLLPLFLPAPMPPGALLGGALGALTGTWIIRAALRAVVGEASGVLILGSGSKARGVAKAIQDGGEDSYRVVSLVDPNSLAMPGAAPLSETARRLKVHYVVQACDDASATSCAEALLSCRLAGQRVYDAAGFSERVLRRLPIEHLRAADFAYADELTVSWVRRVCQRGFDLVVSAALVILASPVLVWVALAIKLDSKGPIFYCQERVGLGGKVYRLWKFRSMRTDAEKNGAVWAKADDDRVTRVGRFIRKTRMDEIPQVLCVLLGDMSFVGPRPERPVFTAQLKEAIPFYGLREAVRPGITGWAQIRYPYGASVEDARNKLEFDLYYVKNGSLFLDVAILFHTVRHVLLGRGAR